MVNKRERELIERYRKAGLAVHDARLNQLFMFLIRPLTTVGIEKGRLFHIREDEMVKEIKHIEFSSPIKGIHISPHIFDKKIAKAPDDYVKFRKSENAISVGIEINFEIWINSSIHDRIDIALETCASQ